MSSLLKSRLRKNAAEPHAEIAYLAHADLPRLIDRQHASQLYAEDAATGAAGTIGMSQVTTKPVPV
jgi:hypothetical protein